MPITKNKKRLVIYYYQHFNNKKGQELCLIFYDFLFCKLINWSLITFWSMQFLYRRDCCFSIKLINFIFCCFCLISFVVVTKVEEGFLCYWWLCVFYLSFSWSINCGIWVVCWITENDFFVLMVGVYNVSGENYCYKWWSERLDDIYLSSCGF